MAKAEKSITYPNTPDVDRYYRGKTFTYSDYGKVSKIEGSTVTIKDRGGIERTWDMSHITKHTKDTTTGFAQMTMKHVSKSKTFTL